MLHIITSFLTSFIITYLAIPSIIKLANIRKLFDEPDDRKMHNKTIPALGGIALFSGIFLSMLFWTEMTNLQHLRSIALSMVIMFLMGLKDDIVPMNPYKKLIGQLIAACVVIYSGGIRIENLHGLFMIYELPYIASFLLTLFTIIVIVNSFNLIDGIDGLAGSIGTISSITFGVLFLLNGHINIALIAFSLTGALLGFLRFNFSPAKIFMGDGGSLTVGLLLSIICIKFLNTNIAYGVEGLVLPVPVIAIAILIIPLADTLRVFIIRLSRGKSPFRPDRNHLHHVLLKLNFSHKEATLILGGANTLIIALILSVSYLEIHILLMMLIITVSCMIHICQLAYSRKMAQVSPTKSNPYMTFTEISDKSSKETIYAD